MARTSGAGTDFERMPIEPEDFIYADPPYDVQFTQYSKGGFDWDEQSARRSGSRSTRGR